MEEKPSDDAGQRLKSPYAGMWCVVCSVVSAPAVFPVALLIGTLAYTFEHIDADGWAVVVFIAATTSVFLMLLFLVWGFVIGGKYTRWACTFCAFGALLVLVLM